MSKTLRIVIIIVWVGNLLLHLVLFGMGVHRLSSSVWIVISFIVLYYIFLARKKTS